MTMTLTSPPAYPDPAIATNVIVRGASPLGNRIQAQWQLRLETELPQHSAATRSSILLWLLGAERDWESLSTERLQIVERGMDYRFRLLQQRYLGLAPTTAYKTLMQRLGGLVVVRERIRTWIALSNDSLPERLRQRQRTVVDVLAEVIQEMLARDRQVRGEIELIGKCTNNPRLRDALLFASIEEYCLRPIRNHPLIAHRFVNYLRQARTGGMTNIPQGELVSLVADEVIGDDDTSLNLVDLQALEDYYHQQDSIDTQVLRDRVKQEFRAYLIDRLGEVAGEWLDAYRQGKKPDEIAVALGLSVMQIYRLRDKIYYHAIKLFALKAQPELVAQWLQISLQEHDFGLSASQWQQFEDRLEPIQLEILNGIRAGNSIDSIAKTLNLKSNHVFNAWLQIYLTAQKIRRLR
jgi:hypothetical protein